MSVERELDQSLEIEWIGIDWGTSQFRLLGFSSRGETSFTVEEPVGIGQLQPKDAAHFLKSVLERYPPVPVMACGMMGSTLGLQEVPYLECPVSVHALASQLAPLSQWDFEHVIHIVPGLKWRAGEDVDVMRGEEVQMIGWLAANPGATGLVCLPGTHSKWVTVKDNEIDTIQTALTGELFGMLTSHSVLVQGEQREDLDEVRRGVEYAVHHPQLISSLFSTRSRVVAGQQPSGGASSYLSGLLIGNELLAFKQQSPELDIIGSQKLCDRYAFVADFLGLSYKTWDGLEMTAKGLRAIWQAR